MDNDSLRLLYEKYSREIYLYLLSLSGDPRLSEDVMQDTFVKALLSLDRSHANLRAWLYTVARNLYFDHTRRKKLESEFEGSFEPAEAPGPEELLQVKIRNERLREALMRLEPKKREIITLQYFSGLSVKEIAEIMRLSQENVRVLAFRAKKEMKKYLEDKDELF